MSQPLLSLCIPTHHGRRAVLEQLLDGIATELERWDGPPVEVCVSDNAARDGTEELIETVRPRLGCALVYRRQPEDVGLARNLLSAIGLASGRYCWLLGSDDLVAPGGLGAVCKLLEAVPGATGYVIRSLDVDESDPALRSRQPPRGFFPPEERTTRYETSDAVLEACGNAWTGISWNVVAREPWMEAARDRLPLVLAHPVWPQVVLMGTMALARPDWVWHPAAVALHRRNAPPFLFEADAKPLAERWAELVGGLADAWEAVLGPGDGWRRRMCHLNRVWGGVHDARATKLYERPSLGAQTRLVKTWVHAFGHVPAFRRRVLPALLLPVWATRRRHDPTRGEPRGAALDAGRDRISLHAELPGRVACGDAPQVLVQIRNEGRRTLRASGPAAVCLSQRWATADGRPLAPAELGLNTLAAHPVELPHPVRPGGSAAAWLAVMAPLEPGEYRLDVAPHQHGRGWLDEAGIGPALTAAVEVG